MLLFIHDLLIIHKTFPLNELLYNFLQGIKPPANFPLAFNFPRFPRFANFAHFPLFSTIDNKTGIF